jgi:hypothetical protein
LEKYRLFLLGNSPRTDGWKLNLFVDDMILKEEAQNDLWDIIKSFPYVSRARQALPAMSEDVTRASHRYTGEVEVENSMRSLDYLIRSMANVWSESTSNQPACGKYCQRNQSSFSPCFLLFMIGAISYQGIQQFLMQADDVCNLFHFKRVIGGSGSCSAFYRQINSHQV